MKINFRQAETKMKSMPIAKYQDKVMRLLQQYPPRPGEIRHITVNHDEWCSLLNRRGPCNCRPIVKAGHPMNGGV